MTPSTTRDSVPANNRPEDGARVSVRDGQIIGWMDGVYGPIRPMTAWAEALWLRDSPFPASRQRAADLRASLNRIGYLQ